jgi:3-hydroxyacyl-CoA dehydrogenase
MEPSCSSSVRGCVWTGICNDAVVFVAACDLTVVTVGGVMVVGRVKIREDGRSIYGVAASALTARLVDITMRRGLGRRMGVFHWFSSSSSS